MITLLAAVLSGIMFYLAQGYDHVWALVWLAPVPLLWLAYGNTRTWQVIGASAIALLGGAGYLLQSPYLHLIPPLVITSVLVSRYRAVLRRGLVCALRAAAGIAAPHAACVSGLLDSLRVPD